MRCTVMHLLVGEAVGIVLGAVDVHYTNVNKK